MADQRLTYLFDRFLRDECSPEEMRELSSLALHKEHEEQVRALLGDYWNKTGEAVRMPDSAAEEMLRTMLAKKAPVRRMFWKRIAVAASILLAVALGGYYLLRPASKPTEEIVTITTDDIPAPSGNKAMITLPDGRSISIDSLSSLSQNSVSLVKTADGKIVYSGNTSALIYNTLTNPRGSKVIDMQLADGSHVWLNAGSSVTYPIAFSGNERKVAVTGEAYFEVAHDKTKPFTVSKGDMSVQVLGTHFNVNAYENESAIKVTLLEGSVRVRNNQTALTIQPNQQAVITANNVLLNTNVDVGQVMAWKNGLFSFKDSDLQTVMRQIAVWYDVDVQYESGVPAIRFSGDIGRTLSLKQILDILTETRIHYRIEEKKLVIMK